MFTGLKVLELASVLAGPSVGQFFAELGADVIKVENKRTGGDITRTWRSAGEVTDDRSAYFCSVNWGKQSIALDLSVLHDQQVVRRLAARSDIIIASFKPGDAKKLGVSYEQLSTDNSRLIYGQVTGYGSDHDRVGYDAILQAETGFMDLNGYPDGPPTKMPVALVDLLAAHQLKEGLLLALLKRERNQMGSFIEVSLVQAAVASLANQATNWLVGKQIPKRQGSAHPNIAPYGESFVTQDGKRILLAVGTDRQFSDLCEVLMLGSDSGAFSSNVERVRNREKLNLMLGEKIIQWNSEKLLDAMHGRKIPAGLIQNVREALEMEELRDIMLNESGIHGVRTFIAKEAGPDGNRNWKLGSAKSSLLPPPHFGEHTEKILSAL